MSDLFDCTVLFNADAMTKDTSVLKSISTGHDIPAILHTKLANNVLYITGGEERERMRFKMNE